jgi:preprotein translocase subunit SecD
MLQMPGVSDVAAVKRIVGRVAKLEFRLVALPRSDLPTITLPLKNGGTVTLEDEVKMGGDAVEKASVSMDAQRGVTVGLSLTSEGSKIFARITSENVGRQLAIILDGKVYSTPVIESAIVGGHAVITGGFSPDEARELALVLRSGALPATLKVMEERTVGPTLGFESIKAGVLATLVGLAMIGIFMTFYYKKAGLVAVFTLTLNAVLILAALSAFGATLTLPGIAGLALTLGIAVDSNVIIFERIKDELANGSGRDAAVEAGFDKAYSALLDANLTGLLSAVVLYIFGTGPIRGFAVTLSIGTLTTLFCAIYVAKVIFDLLPLRSRGGLSI